MNPALELAILSALEAELAARKAVLKETFIREHGRGTQFPTVEGVEVGQVTINKAPERWSVVDSRAFLAWVKAERPAEVITTESVNPAYQRSVLDRCASEGAPVTRDGEVIPGVDCVVGKPSVTVKPDVDAIKSLVTSGRLSWVVPEELESPR